MTYQERKGIAFGFGLIVVWLTILTFLTGSLTYDKIKTIQKENKIVQPATLEPIPLQDLIG